MKAEELRFGNIVFNPNLFKNTAVDILDIYDLAEGRLYKDFLPIPLTEEWLLKFAFEINMDNFDWNAGIGTNCIGDFELSLRHTDNVGWFYKSKCTPIKYVHQLQNLYFALTGKELTIKTN